MTGRSSGLLRMEVRRSLVLWPAPFMAAALAWVVYEGLLVEIWFWPDTVTSIQYSLILYGPLVGGISVWAAGREKRRGMDDMLVTTPVRRLPGTLPSGPRPRSGAFSPTLSSPWPFSS